MELNLEILRTLCRERKIKWSMHSLKRMRERKINSADYRNCILTGEIIEQYPDDRPLPSCLISGYSVNNSHLHDVVGSDNNYIYAITTYYPSLFEWENDYKTRKVR